MVSHSDDFYSGFTNREITADGIGGNGWSSFGQGGPSGRDSGAGWSCGAGRGWIASLAKYGNFMFR